MQSIFTAHRQVNEERRWCEVKAKAGLLSNLFTTTTADVKLSDVIAMCVGEDKLRYASGFRENHSESGVFAGCGDAARSSEATRS